MNAIVVSDRNFKLIGWNPAAEKMYGWRAEEVLGRNAFEILKTDKTRRRPTNTRLVQQGSWFGEASQIRKDGTRFWVEMSANEVRNSEGEVTEYISISHDITDRIQHREEILSIAKFPSENPNPVLRVRADGTVLFANKSAQSISSIWGGKVGGLAPQDLRDRIQSLLKRNKKNAEFEECVNNKYYSLGLTRISGENYLNIYARDITLQKHAEEEQQQAAEKHQNTT